MIRGLIEQLLSSLVPPVYQQYLPVLSEGLQFFCESLSEPRRQALLLAQAGLTTHEERLAKLLQQCPTLHKLGQLLARDERLSPELRANLQRLESMVPHSEVPKIPELEIEAALAEGSVAIAALCRFEGKPVVAKILKPGLHAVLDEEFALWGQLGDRLTESCVRYGIPSLDYREVAESVTRLLRDELDPKREQHHLRQAARQFRFDSDIKIPEVVNVSSVQVTVMEWIEGEPFLEARRAPELLSTALRALLVDPFFSTEETALFHADPHPGNLMVTRDGRLALLDWGSTLHLSKTRREEITSILLDAWMQPGRREGGLSALIQPGADTPADLIMLRKILFHVEGMVAHLDPGRDLTAELFLGAALRIGWELPTRWLTPLDWRGHASHLSTLDLWRVSAHFYGKMTGLSP